MFVYHSHSFFSITTCKTKAGILESNAALLIYVNYGIEEKNRLKAEGD
jgi:hypothetical protein